MSKKPQNINLIDHRYQVIKNLGDGLSGEVKLVSDENGNQVALKFLKKVQLNLSREEALENFKNEFSILKELNHPNISRILDFGFDEKIQKYYFTTEFIEGEEFDRACENQPVEVQEKLIIQVLRALNYLHTRKIYHFDIKPQNILVSYKEGKPFQVKMIDFGLAGFASSRKKVGTPAYMAPEVIKGGHLDGRVDLYSFGMVIYKALVGKLPLVGKSLKETLNNHLKVTPNSILEYKPDLPKYWDKIVSRLIEKNPNQRYTQASFVIRDLNFLSGKNFEIETKDTKLSYLPEKGTLIGRENEWQVITSLFEKKFVNEQEHNEQIIILSGAKGTGKTRLISELKYYSQLRNVPVITYRQYTDSENLPKKFVVIVEEGILDSNSINELLQETFQKKCLIIWVNENISDKISNSIELKLQNYDMWQLRQYVESVTGLSDAPQNLLDEIFKRTQGNPLFVTEFIKSLFEKGLFCDDSGQWTASTFQDIEIDFSKIKIPDSVEDCFVQQSKELNDTEIEILNWLAVNKGPMNISDLTHLLGTTDIHLVLLQLIEKGIIEKVTREHDYYFINYLFPDVLYKMISQEHRKNYHDKLAKLFEKNENHLRKFYFHIGYGSDEEKSKEALFNLALLEFKDARYLDAKQFLEKNCNWKDFKMNSIVEKSFELLAEIEVSLRSFSESQEIYFNLLEQYRDESSLEKKINIYDQLVNVKIKAKEYDEVIKVIEKAEKLIEKSKEFHLHEMIFSNYKALVILRQGKIDEALQIFKDNHDIWCGWDSKDRDRVSNNKIYDVYLKKNDLEKAVAICLDNISYLKDSQNKHFLAQNYYALGNAYYQQLVSTNSKEKKAELTKIGIEAFQVCESIARDIHAYPHLLRTFNGIGNFYSFLNELQKSLEYYQRALVVSRKIDDQETSAYISFNIANILNKLGKVKDAYSYHTYAYNILNNVKTKTSQVTYYLFFICLGLIEVLIAQDHLDEANSYLENAEELFAKNDFLQSVKFWLEVRKSSLLYKSRAIDEAYLLYIEVKELANSEEEKDELEKLAHCFGEREQEKVLENHTKKGVVMRSQPQSLHTQSPNDDLKKIIEINKIINSEYNINQLLKLVLNYAIQLSNAEAGFVLLLDKNGEFEVNTSINQSEEDYEKISFSIAKQAIETGEIINSEDALEDERFDQSQSIVLNELKSVLCLPIKSKNKSMGVFYLDNRYRTNAFEDCQIDLLNAFCDQVGIVLENVKLIEELQKAKVKLETKLSATETELADVKEKLLEESGVFQTKYTYDSIISHSEEMLKVFRLLDKVTETNLSIFIHGQSGTGKELIAKALHYNHSERSQKRFVAVNCGAIPSNLMESELFGHKAGSFTGASRDKKGLFEEANGGTLFLDEVADLPLELQVKLLRVLQEGEVQRIGESRPIKVDVRVVCASHKDLEKLAKENVFREDLYYRLCQLKIDLPALHDRSEDIPHLAKHFVKKYCKQNKVAEEYKIPPIFMKSLLNYSWPGNIRELENLISVACALAENGELNIEALPDHYGIKQESSSQKRSFENSNKLSDLSTYEEDSTGELTSSIKIDGVNFYEPTKTWKDYEAVILAKVYQKFDKKKKDVGNALELSHSTIYKKVDDLKLDDDSNPLYAENFEYIDNFSMKDYIEMIFSASLKFHNDHPYAAIRQLGVSQGYFYKIMKSIKEKENGSEEASTKI